jgi:hypothetical protein
MVTDEFFFAGFVDCDWLTAGSAQRMSQSAIIQRVERLLVGCWAGTLGLFSRSYWLATELLERIRQPLCDVLRSAALDFATRHEVDEFAVAEKCKAG